MSPGVQVFLSGTLTFGAPLLICLSELIALRRGRGGYRGPDPARDPRPLPPDAPSSRIQKPLPACLIPQLPPPRRVLERREDRVLEPAGD